MQLPKRLPAHGQKSRVPTVSRLFFLPYSPLIITPLWWGPYPIRVSSYLGLLYSSLLLHRLLSLIVLGLQGCLYV